MKYYFISFFQLDRTGPDGPAVNFLNKISEGQHPLEWQRQADKELNAGSKVVRMLLNWKELTPEEAVMLNDD